MRGQSHVSAALAAALVSSRTNRRCLLAEAGLRGRLNLFPPPQQLWFDWAGDLRGERLAGRAAAIKFICNNFASAPREFLFALYLDAELRLREIFSLGRGSIDGVHVSIAEIIRQGFAVDAACFILIHNHPSGDPTPSEQDIRVTRRIREVSEDLDMPLVDHLIVAAGEIRSVGGW